MKTYIITTRTDDYPTILGVELSLKAGIEKFKEALKEAFFSGTLDDVGISLSEVNLSKIDLDKLMSLPMDIPLKDEDEEFYNELESTYRLDTNLIMFEDTLLAYGINRLYCKDHNLENELDCPLFDQPDNIIEKYIDKYIQQTYQI